MNEIIYCINDSYRKKTGNVNFADVYFSELFNLLGITAECCSEDELNDKLNGAMLCFLGLGDYSENLAAITQFLNRGGKLISFCTDGIRELAGVVEKGAIRKFSEYDIVSYLTFEDNDLEPVFTRPYRLPILSEVFCCECFPDVEILARSDDYNIPVIFRRKAGKGEIIYFSFSLNKTLWFISQGRPVERDLDGDGYTRAMDSLIRNPSDDDKLPSVDLYLRFLENLIAENAGVMLHQIPPANAQPADYVVFFTGDEDWCAKEMFVAAEEFRKRNLPYQVNLQPTEDGKGFTIDKESFDKLEKTGVELTLHFDFISPGLYRYDRSEMERQLNLYKNAFGKTPSGANTHWFIYNGFGNVPRWYKEAGIKYSIYQYSMPTCLTDLNKLNLWGVGFGTTYPTHAYDDFEHGNQKISEVTNLKIIFYEPRVFANEDYVQIRAACDDAYNMAYYLNVFIHPTYFTCAREAVIKSVDAFLDYGKDKNVVYSGSGELVDWWNKRCWSILKKQDEKSYYCNLKADCTLKFPSSVKSVYVDGNQVDLKEKNIAGKNWKLTVVRCGEHNITIVK